MNLSARAVFSAGFLAAVLVAPEASATNYSLWIHGRNTSQSTQIGNYADFSYWGSSSTNAGVNKKAVNWDGVSHVSDSNYAIRNALDCFCTGSNWCYIAAHSAGDLQIGYALSLYGGTARYKKNAVPNSSGVCGNTDGTTQTGWNIKWVDIGGGAAGGSELADDGYWITGYAIDQDLVTTTARALYDHNNTRANWFYMFAGAKGTLYAAVLPGQDDEAVAYHTSGGVSGSSGGSYCNPGDWFCGGTLTTGSSACSDGQPKWSYHTVQFRDDNEAYNHYTNGSWAGIISQVVADMAAYAF